MSHERLERDILTQPFTLRDAIEHVRNLPISETSDVTLPNADAILAFAANGCQISQAALFAVTEHGLDPCPAATVGAPFELDAKDVLLLDCLEHDALSHLRQAGTIPSNYLVCAPIKAASGRMCGVLVVRQMSFLALNHENLQLLLVLLNYYADGIEQHALVAPVQLSLPQCPYDFALEVARLAHMHGTSGVRSSLIGMVFPDGMPGDALIEQLKNQRRTLDLLWAYDLGNARVAIALLPLADDSGVDGYLLRLENVLNTHLEDAEVATYRGTIDFSEPCYGLTHIVSRCNRHA